MKTWQTFLIILLCVGATLVSNAQNTFSKAYDLNYGSELGVAAYEVDDGYILFGTGPASPTDPTYITKVLKVDFNGNFLWAKSYGGSGIIHSINYGAGGATNDGNGYYYVTGAYADTIEPEDVIVAKLNTIGDTLWSRTFGGPKQELPYSVVYDTSQHLIYVTGGTESFGQGTLNAFIWVLDTLGNTIDTWFYGGGNYDYGKSIVKIEDTIYLSGYTNSFSNNGDPFLMKLDSLGAVASLQFYGTQGSDREAGISSNGVGDLIVMWGILDTLQDASFVSYIDLQGEVVWRKILNWYGYINQVKFMNNNSIIIAGVNKSSRRKGNIAKIDSLGNLLWYREYSFNDPDISGLYASCVFYNFEVDKQTRDILCFGNTQRDPALGDSTGQDFWLVKLDSMGCLVPGCDTITEVGIQTIETIGTQVTVYPNPANGKATVLLNHGKANSEALFTLYGVSGQVVTTEKHLLNPYGFGEWQVDLTGREPGIYIYHILQDGKVIEGKLLVE